MPIEPLHLFRSALAILEPGSLAVGRIMCPACGPSLAVRLSRSAIGVRCLYCRASAVSMSLMAAVRDDVPNLQACAAYELSSRGAVFKFLAANAARVAASEYLDGVAPGESRDGVLCQDVHRLTFPDASFDLCTSTEVMEHVADDAAAFSELRRVLKPGGALMFTVPITSSAETVERARVVDGVIEHILEPSYHSDRLRGQGKVLAFRDYGLDLPERLRSAGFEDARIDWRFSQSFMHAGAPVVEARAPA